MKITLINIYNNTVLPKSQMKGDYGNAFYIKMEDRAILYDVGRNGDILLHNMRQLKLELDDLVGIVLSHGHFDHSGGLTKLLEHFPDKKFEIIAHPKVLERKKTDFFMRLLIFMRYGLKEIGFPELSDQQKKKISFIFSETPYRIADCLHTVGEVSHRPYNSATKNLYKYRNSKWVEDDLLDDLSLAIHTKEGIVLVCGCCHSGLLNTCLKVESKWPSEKIRAIVGGTHLMDASVGELDSISQHIEKKYESLQIYFNHCSGERSYKYFLNRFGKERIKRMGVGYSLQFDC